MKEKIKKLFDSRYVKYVEAGEEFCLRETHRDGKGVCNFKTADPVLLIYGEDNRESLIWALKNKKAAEGAFFKFSDKSLVLVEMKSKLKKKDWEKAQEQFSGMYLCAKSILHLLEIDEPKIILAYIVYSENQVTYEEYSVMYENRDSYIESKLPIGIKSELLESWRKEEIILPLGMKAKVIKAMRNAHGNYNFGWV